MSRLICQLASVALAASGMSVNAMSGWKPERDVEIVVGGTGTVPDRLAKIIDRVCRAGKVITKRSSRF